MRRLRRIGRWTGIVFLSLVGFLVLATAGLMLWTRTSLPTLDGQQAVQGLAADVTIDRDQYGIPHIKAQTLNDAYRALGYVHAQDRLFQMEMMRRAGLGKLSEVTGEFTVDFDHRMRVFGLGKLVQDEAAALSPEARAAFDAYAEGVNIFLENRSGSLPPEFLLLPDAPEPWKVEHSLIWIKLMGLMLTADWGGELERAGLAGTLTPEQIEDLYPVIDGSFSLSSRIAPNTIRQAKKAASIVQEGAGSNLWVVPGDLTASGMPIVANDPHLGFGVPNTWYLARIETPERAWAGATAAGFPLVVLGHNSKVAWSFTNGYSDTADVFEERVSPDDVAMYMTPDGVKPFETREEVINVRFGDPVTVQVRATRNGPVISDAAKDDDAGTQQKGPYSNAVLALRHTALSANPGTVEAFFKAQIVNTAEEFKAALNKVVAPQQNIGFGDVDGGAGFFSPALIPIRKQAPSLLPAPGWDGSHDWTGFIPYAELPQRMHPSAKIIVNANNRPVGPDYPYELGTAFTSPLRADAIEEALAIAGKQTVAASIAAQVDAKSLAALALLAHVDWSSLTENQAEGPIVNALREWDGRLLRDRPEGLIFYAWYRRLAHEVMADELGGQANEIIGGQIERLLHMFEARPVWCDNVSTTGVENCGQAMQAAWRKGLQDLRERYGDDWQTWRWGDAHKARFVHQPLGMIPGLGDLLFNVTVENDGDRYTSNAGYVSLSDKTLFNQVHGASYRAVYDLADLANSRFIQAVGQSGNPFSPHYSDLAPLWSAGETIRLGPLQGEPAHRLVLTPQ